mgnify:CR=1 FL=1
MPQSIPSLKMHFEGLPLTAIYRLRGFFFVSDVEKTSVSDDGNGGLRQLSPLVFP